MGFSGDQNPEVGYPLSMDFSRKRKRRDVAMTYDEAAMAMYGEKAILNMPHVSDSDSIATFSVSNVFLGATTTTTGVVSDSMTCASRPSEICDNNVGEGKTTGMNVQFPVDFEGQSNSTMNEIQDIIDMEAEVKKEAKPGDESIKETDYSFLDGLEFFDDISMDFGGNSFWDDASFSDECEFFNVDEFLSSLI